MDMSWINPLVWLDLV